MKASEITDSMRRGIHREPARVQPQQCWDGRRTPERCPKMVLRPTPAGSYYCPEHMPPSPNCPGPKPITKGFPTAEDIAELDRLAQAPRTAPQTPHERTEAPAKTKRAPGLAKPRGRKGMNKTEAAYALILEARKRAGDIHRYGREMITLRWEDGMTYSADFAVWESIDSRLLLIETKGAFIEGDALVKFRAARAHWPEFRFEMWQLKKGTWTQLL